jgi:hypothetical protein
LPEFIKYCGFQSNWKRSIPILSIFNAEFVIAEFGFHYEKCHNIPVVYTFHMLWEEYIGNRGGSKAPSKDRKGEGDLRKL